MGFLHLGESRRRFQGADETDPNGTFWQFIFTNRSD
jgi:hypothetical protein